MKNDYTMQKNGQATNTPERRRNSFLSDLKALFKALVLVFNVLPVFTGFWLALYFTNSSFTAYWDVFLLTMIGSTFVIAGALLFNNWYEVDLDREMTRTRNRPTVTGTISLKAVLALAISLTIVGLILLLFTTIEATIYAFVGWFTYVVLYTFWSKRRHTLNTVIGSISGAVTPLIGWAAIASTFHIVPIALGSILFLWQIPHTFAIAIRRYSEYQAAGVPMLPVVRGIGMTKRQMVIYIICLLPLPFFLAAFGPVFIMVATLLNIGWLVMGIQGFFTKNDFRWARFHFIYSLVYLIVLFPMLMIITL